MTDGFVLGVDLGTSHTVAMLRRPDGRTRPLLFDGRPLLSSAVHLDATGRLHVGADALRPAPSPTSPSPPPASCRRPSSPTPPPGARIAGPSWPGRSAGRAGPPTP